MILRVASTGLVATALCACDSPPETVAGSDVPQIVGLENRHSSELAHDGETLVSGRFLYRGEMKDPVRVADRTTEMYWNYGWKLEESRVFPTGAMLLFAKGDRQAEVDLKCNALNPSMSSGAIDLHRRGEVRAPLRPSAAASRDAASDAETAADAKPAPDAGPVAPAKPTAEATPASTQESDRESNPPTPPARPPVTEPVPGVKPPPVPKPPPAGASPSSPPPQGAA